MPRSGAAGAEIARSAHRRERRRRRRASLGAGLAIALLLAGPVGAEESQPPGITPVSADTGAGAGVPEPSLGAVVRAPAPRAPREDEAAAATVVVPDRTPRSVAALPDVLGEAPGVTVTRLGGLGAWSTLSLRGSTPDQVRVFLDGVPLNLAVGGAVDLSTVPLGDVERIEIYRGMTPIAFGESALGGVVSVTTRDPAGRRLTAELGGGSFATVVGGATAAFVLPGLRLYAGLHASSARNDFPYPSDNGTTLDHSDDRMLSRRNAAMGQLDGVLRAAVVLPGARELKFGLLGFARNQGVPGPGLFATTQAALGTGRGLAYAAYEGPGDLGAGSAVRVRLFGAANRQRFHDPIAEIGIRPSLTDDVTVTAGLTANVARPLGDGLELGTLLEARTESFLPTDAAESTPAGVPASRQVGALGAELRWEPPGVGLTLLPSLRAELARDVTTGRDPRAGALGPSEPIVRLLPVARLGALYRLGRGLALRANGGRYARLPSTSELYGDNGFLAGNPGLRPETGLNADLGVAWRRRFEAVRLETELFAFGARVEDLIQWQQNAQWVVRADNVTRARIVGLEAALRLEAPGWRVTAQATLTDARDDGTIAARTGRLLPLRPPLRAYVRPELRGLAVGPVVLGAYSEVELTGGNFLDNANLVAVPARLLLHAGLFAELPGPGLRLVVNVQNLADSRINDVSGFPLPGRALFATLRWASADAPESR